MKSDFLNDLISDSYSFSMEKNRHSCIAAALREARFISNRCVETGVVDFRQMAALTPANWSSALVYLIVLDQIGTCFKNKSKVEENIQGNNVYRAIANFGELLKLEAYAIESLRHSFAHNFGLANVSVEKKSGKIRQSHTHLFELIADKEAPFIKLASKKWDGSFKIKNKADRVCINLWKLGDFVETLFKKLKNEYENDNVILILSEVEARTRFTFKTS